MFSTIGIIGKPNHPETNQSIAVLLEYLSKKSVNVLLDERLEYTHSQQSIRQCCVDDIGKSADLAIVIGGDGSMLGAARLLAKYDVSVIGVNRGNLGFLTDIAPDKIVDELEQIFAQQYLIEERFLLEIQVIRNRKIISSNLAMNEAILHHPNVANMIEFEVYIDDQFVFSQRADGIIVATPTGSTAYSLSGGGPIVTPNLNALTLMPMFPHTLSNRPLVVDANSCITLIAANAYENRLQVSCDGHVVLSVSDGDEVRIKKADHTLRLLHPPTYDYYRVLRNKLGWGSKLY